MPVWQIEIKDMQFEFPEQVEVKKYKPRHVISKKIMLFLAYLFKNILA